MNPLNKMKWAVAALSLVVSAVHAENIAVVGGKTHTMGKAGVVENATILVKDGKIVSVKSGGTVPDGYRVIDAKGKVVTPGLMNPSSYLGLNYVPSWSDNQDASFSKGKTTIGLDVTWAINPDNMRIPIARIEGVTRAITRFSSGYPSGASYFIAP